MVLNGLPLPEMNSIYGLVIFLLLVGRFSIFLCRHHRRIGFTVFQEAASNKPVSVAGGLRNKSSLPSTSPS